VSAARDIATRWIDTERPPMSQGARAGIALTLLCPAIFLCFFFVGRSTISARAPQPTATQSLPITYAGKAIPARLAGAPAIEATVTVRARNLGSPHPTSTVSNAATHTEAARTPTPASATPPEVAKAPTPASAPSTPTPARHAPPKKAGRVSFDSSG
jgi:hypothetical protein